MGAVNHAAGWHGEDVPLDPRRLHAAIRRASLVTTAAPSAPGTAESGHRGAIILMCQHFYPEMISTGMHMTELAVALTRRGWHISVVCAQPSLLLSEKNVAVPHVMTHQG